MIDTLMFHVLGSFDPVHIFLEGCVFFLGWHVAEMLVNLTWAGAAALLTALGKRPAYGFKNRT